MLLEYDSGLVPLLSLVEHRLVSHISFYSDGKDSGGRAEEIPLLRSSTCPFASLPTVHMVSKAI